MATLAQRIEEPAKGCSLSSGINSIGGVHFARNELFTITRIRVFTLSGISKQEFGYFFYSEGREILVVYQPHKWEKEIRNAGYPHVPRLTRDASPIEVEVLADRVGFTGWIYQNVDELIEDEVRTGTDHLHLYQLLDATKHMPEAERRAS